ncbi:MAG: hypothetical protein AAB641_00820 [Patescibacteria group bacterium]
MKQQKLDLGIAASQPILFPVGPQIAAGVRALDALAGPNWRERVKRKHPIASYTSCVLCQVFGGDYAYGCEMLGIDPKSKEPAQLGFNVIERDSPHADREFEALTHGWELVIKNPSLQSIKRLKIAA